MNRIVIAVLLVLCGSASAFCQETGQFIESAGGGKFRLHYNEQYFLVNKDCEFLSRIRLAQFNEEKQFLGNFTDYDLNGALVLTGSYAEGKKQGTFKAYYPSGFLKWQGDYVADEPRGQWNYYYPDGKPKTVIEFRENSIYVMESWNEKGKAVVRNGDGWFSLKDYQFGYNNTGHEALLYLGRLKGGLPKDHWSVSYVFPDGETSSLMELGSDELAIKTQVKFAETESFANAENFISKRCAIDEQTNFTAYLRNTLNLNSKLREVAQELPETIEISLKVSSKGVPAQIRVQTPLTKAAERALVELLESVSYWIPSQKDGKVMDDILHVELEVIRTENGALAFGFPNIDRINGK